MRLQRDAEGCNGRPVAPNTGARSKYGGPLQTQGPAPNTGARSIGGSCWDTRRVCLQNKDLLPAGGDTSEHAVMGGGVQRDREEHLRASFGVWLAHHPVMAPARNNNVHLLAVPPNGTGTGISSLEIPSWGGGINGCFVP